MRAPDRPDLRPTPNAAEPSRIVYGSWRRRWRTSIGFLAIALFMAITVWPKLLSDGAPGLTLSEARQSLFALFLLPIGLWLSWLDLTGRPKLILGRRRLVLKGMFWTRAVRWERLGAFYLIKAGAARSRKLFSARAPILRPDSDTETRRFFTVDDLFSQSIPVILREIAKRGHVHMRWPEEPKRLPDCGTAEPPSPWFSVALPIVFLIPYLLEWLFPAAPAVQGGPAPETLHAFGGADAASVTVGQGYRLLTAPFLHAGWLHLAADMLALGLAARLADRLIGRAWTSAVFIVGTLSGSLISVLFAAQATILVGGAGGGVALLACIAVVSFRLVSGRKRLGLQYRIAEIAIPALIPLSPDAAAIHIAYTAHAIGAGVGLATGAFLVSTWKPRERLPRFSRVGTGIACTGAALVGIAVCIGIFQAGHRAYQAHRIMVASMAASIPDARLPKAGSGLSHDASALAHDYPTDPRPHLYLSAIALKKNDKVGAEREARAALALLPGRTPVFSESLTQTAQALLAAILFDEKKNDEAQTLAAKLCVNADPSVKASAIFNRLVQDKLCPPLPNTVSTPAPHRAARRSGRRVHTRAGVSEKRGL